MRSELAYNIIESYGLITGKTSRNILNKIINGEVIAKEELPKNVNQSQVDHLRILYQKKLEELKSLNIKPRYLPFYYLIKDKYPNFVWSAGQSNNEIDAPRVHNLRPSLLSLLLDQVNEMSDTILHRKYLCINKLPSSVINSLDKFMKQSGIYYPPANEMEEIVKLLFSGIAGNKLTVFIPICPDYAFTYTGNPTCPVEFTFTELGCENGIIAQWVLSAIKNLSETLKACHINAEFIVAMSDFEAFSEDNLKTFSITKEEFFRRTALSKEAFKAVCPINAKVMMFTELCNEEKWKTNIESIKQRFENKDYGYSGIDKNVLLRIVENRKALYSRWYGEKESLEDYINVVLDQGMMYAVMGIVINEHYQNCLVFAADNKVMRYFYSVARKIPTLYLNKIYS